jgi:TonB family protein
MDSDQTSRLGIALAISIGLHVFIAVVAEVGSKPAEKKAPPAPPVEITRVAMDGSTLPVGPGESSFNSPASRPNLDFGPKYNLDAGVPVKIPIPPKQQQETRPQVQQPTQNVPPVNSVPNQPATQQPPDYTPPVYQQEGAGQAQPSTPSRPSTAGNLGAQRSRGPNRVAFPEYTVEPQVPATLVGGGVTNSVDVTVEIAADGSHSERIVRSSGSAQVDGLVLEALKQWRWDPAAREGQAIASTQNFKFTFKPR